MRAVSLPSSNDPRRELVRACTGVGRYYGAIIGAAIGAAFGFGATGLMAIPLLTAGGVAGLLCGPLWGRMAAGMGRRIWSPFGWTLLGAIGMLPVPIVAALFFWKAGDFHYLAQAWWWILYGCLPLGAGAGAGATVGIGVRRGRSSLTRVSSLIVTIEEAAAAEPARFGRRPTELTPASAPAGGSGEIAIATEEAT